MLVFLWAALAVAGPTFTGPAVTAGARSSIDVIDQHLELLAMQARYGRAQSYAGLTTAWAPGEFLLADGQRVAGNLTRARLNLGAGYGEIEKFAVFGGANVDLVQPLNPVGTPIPNFGGSAQAQGMLHLGVSVLGVELTAGSMQDQLGTGREVDAFGNYQPPLSDGQQVAVDAERPGRPQGAPTEADEAPWRMSVYSLYETRTGAFLSIAVGDVPQYVRVSDPTGDRYESDGFKRRIVQFDAHLQPLKRFLPEAVGLPMAAILALDPVQDAYQESPFYEEAGRDLSEEEVRDQTEAKGDKAVELGTDDLLGLGIRVHTSAMVTPKAGFRHLELGWISEDVLPSEVVMVAARATGYQRNGVVQGAADAFVMVRPPSEKLPSGFTASYSYNSPNPSTFLPMPNAHVFGLQATVGNPEASRPLIPLVREVLEEGGE